MPSSPDDAIQRRSIPELDSAATEADRTFQPSGSREGSPEIPLAGQEWGFRKPQSIVGMKLVDGMGNLVRLRETDTEALEAARVSIGALGIVTEVTIQCVPLYDLEHTTYWCKFDDVIDHIDTLNQENERMLLWWLVPPFGPKDNVLIVTMNPPGTPAGILGASAGGAAASVDRTPLPMDVNDVFRFLGDVFGSQPGSKFHKVIQQHGARHDGAVVRGKCQERSRAPVPNLAGAGGAPGQRLPVAGSTTSRRTESSCLSHP